MYKLVLLVKVIPHFIRVGIALYRISHNEKHMLVKKRINTKEPTEFDLLRLFVEEMENQGVSRKSIHMGIDESMVEKLSADVFETTLPYLQKLADRCLANEWLEHAAMGGKYNCLRLTTTGLGVVRSRQQRQKQLEERGYLKRVSDFIEDHKGLLLALSFVIAFVTLLIKIL